MKTKMLLTFVIVASGVARADLTETLNIFNGNLSAGATNAGLTTPAATYDISYATSCGTSPTSCNTFTVAVSLGSGYVMGDGGILALNLSTAAGSGSIASYTATCQNGSSNTDCPVSLSGNSSEDGFGSFNFKLDDGSGFSDYFTALSVTFTTTSAVSLANLLTNSTTAADAAGHFAPLSNTACTGFAGDAGSGTTGVDNSACNTSPVPEPRYSSLLLSSCLLGFAFLARRFLPQMA